MSVVSHMMVMPTMLEYGLTPGNKVPVLGKTAVSSWPQTGWTSLWNTTGDDSFVTVPLPFTIKFNNTSYTSVFVSSNTYLTFGTGSATYTISASSPAYNKIFLGASDNSYQRVGYLTSGTDYVRIRYEGTAATTGVVGSSNIILEITIFNPANNGGETVIEVLVGNHARSTGAVGIASASAYLSTWTIAANNSYVLKSDATGTSWTVYQSHFFDSTGY